MRATVPSGVVQEQIGAQGMARDRDARHRRLAAIVFTDIVGYSALVNRDEAMGARALDLQRRIVRRLVRRFGGREIETAGDSFLLEFASPFAALRSVIAIQRELVDARARPDDPPVQLRASLHVGDVAHRGREVFGDTVNVAARLMPLSPPGGIALSDQAWLVLRARVAEDARSLGRCELKNIRHAVEVFVLEPAQVQALPADAGEVLERLRGWALLGSRQLPAVAGALLLLVGGSLLAWKLGARIETDHHRRIAVLPFSSFSSSSDDAPLASGLQDSILTNLARAGELRVISRTSVTGYRDTATRKLRQIASELEVDAIVEGSVQRSGDRLLVQVQLIDADNDQHLWAQSYDRRIDDLFDVENEVSREVARAVKVRLTEPDTALADSRPTTSIEAYGEYQRALDLYDGDPAHDEAARAAVKRALEIDPKFALAHLLQSRLHLAAYYKNLDRSEARLALAKRELIQTAELQPQLPELHRGWGLYYYYGPHDLQAAAAEFEAALRLMPNDEDSLTAVSRVYQEQDRLGDALLNQRRAIEIAPKSIDTYVWLEMTLELMRDYEGALQLIDRAQTVEPDNVFMKIARPRVLLISSGDFTKIQPLLKDLDGYPRVLEQFAYYAGDLDEAMRQLRREPEWQGSTIGAASYPSIAAMAWYRWLKGEHEAAREDFRRAAVLLEEALRKPDPAPADQLSTLALSYAALGRADEARQLITRVRRDYCCRNPMSRGDTLTAIAQVEMLLGEPDAAIAELEQILRGSSMLSWHAIALDPAWKQLRSRPSYVAMIEGARRREEAGVAAR